jgi:hypothetical protein
MKIVPLFMHWSIGYLKYVPRLHCVTLLRLNVLVRHNKASHCSTKSPDIFLLMGNPVTNTKPRQQLL